jgi:hypothetical protein
MKHLKFNYFVFSGGEIEGGGGSGTTGSHWEKRGLSKRHHCLRSQLNKIMIL